MLLQVALVGVVEEVEAELRRTLLPAHTERTVTEPGALMAVLETVRRDGYCIVDQELELGLRSLAVPLRSPSGSVVAVSRPRAS